MNDDDLALLDIETALTSPLDVPEEEVPPPNPDEMLVWLHSAHVLERMQAARAFCEIEDPRAVPPLLALLADDCDLVRVSAAYALGRNPCPEAVSRLIECLDREWNGYVRKGIVWALGTCRDARALPPLLSALKYDITAVRLWAASALGQLGNPGAIAPLAAALDTDRAAVVRSNCAWALGILIGNEAGDPDEMEDALDALIGTLEDEDLGVRDDAIAALRRIAHPRGLSVLDRLEREGTLDRQ